MKSGSKFRNLVGGLLGGMFGILSAWYINPMTLPFGVLFGVVFGWWHKEILQMVKWSPQYTKTVTGGLIQVANDTIDWFGRVSGLPANFVRFLRLLVVKIVVGSFVWVFTAPKRLRAYHLEHPTNLARSVETICFLLWITIGAGVGSYLLYGTGTGPKAGGEWLLGLLLGITLTEGGALVSTFLQEDTELAEMRHYYRSWETISRYGIIGFFVYTMMKNIRYSIGLAIFLVLAIGWAFPLFVVGFLGMYVVLLGVMIMQGFYQLLRQTGHWMCFGVTLFITSASWFYFREQFSNDAITWGIALITGVVSGVATEMLRPIVLMFYQNTEVGKWFAKDDDAIDVMDRIFDGSSGVELDTGTGYVGFMT